MELKRTDHRLSHPRLTHPSPILCACTRPLWQDVYFVEICLLNHVCKNRAALFQLQVGELFECEFDEVAFMGLQSLLRG